MAERLAGSEYCERHLIRPPDLSNECKYCARQDLLKTIMILERVNEKLRKDLRERDATVRMRELQLGLKPE